MAVTCDILGGHALVKYLHYLLLNNLGSQYVLLIVDHLMYLHPLASFFVNLLLFRSNFTGLYAVHAQDPMIINRSSFLWVASCTIKKEAVWSRYKSRLKHLL